MKKILLLGSGELGKEFVISAKRLGCYVIACDSYAHAPAMQVADECEIFSMLDETPLRAAIAKHRPDLIVPEIEAIRTEVLIDVEKEGFEVHVHKLLDKINQDYAEIISEQDNILTQIFNPSFTRQYTSSVVPYNRVAIGFKYPYVDLESKHYLLMRLKHRFSYKNNKLDLKASVINLKIKLLAL